MSPPGRNLTLLVVDDERDIRESLTVLLESGVKGARVETASSGSDALDILRSKRVDLIVIDYKMPEMNGVDFLARANAVAPGASSIMITGNTDPVVYERVTQGLGVRRYFVKPLDPDAFLGAVREVLEADA